MPIRPYYRDAFRFRVVKIGCVLSVEVILPRQHRKLDMNDEIDLITPKRRGMIEDMTARKLGQKFLTQLSLHLRVVFRVDYIAQAR